MSRKRFENKLSDKFKDFSPEYEANDDLWNAIESELPAKEKSSKIIWLPFFMLGLIAVSFCYWQFDFESQNLNASTDTKQVDLNSSKSDVAITKTIDEIQIANRDQAKTDKNLFTEKWDQKLSGTQKNTETQTSVNFTTNSFTSFVEANTDDQESIHATNNFSLASKISLPKLSKSKLTNEVIPDKGAFGSEIQSNLDLLKLKQGRLIESKIDPLMLPSLKTTFDSSLDNNRMSDNTKRFSIGFIFGINNLSSNYKLNDAAYASVLESRKGSENTDLQYMMGLQLAYDLSSKWSIQTGLNFYYFQDESFQQSSTNQVDTLENYAMKSTTPSGRDTTILGTALIRSTSNTKTWNYTNRQILTVPIMIIYNTALSEKSKLGFGLGFEKTIFATIEGSETELNETSYDLTIDKESRFGTKGANAFLQIMYKYKLTNHWELRLESNYRHALSSNYNSTAPLEKSFNAIGVAIGTHLKF